MTDTPEIKTTPKKTRGQTFLTVFKYGGLPFSILLGIIAPIIILYVAIVADIIYNNPSTNAIFVIYGSAEVLLVMSPILLFDLAAILQAVVALYSLVHVILRFILKKPTKRKPITIIFRILTLLFGIASIVFSVLLLTQAIPVYDFLRSFVFFCGGSIVLNLVIE